MSFEDSTFSGKIVARLDERETVDLCYLDFSSVFGSMSPVCRD